MLFSPIPTVSLIQSDSERFKNLRGGRRKMPVLFFMAYLRRIAALLLWQKTSMTDKVYLTLLPVASLALLVSKP